LFIEASKVAILFFHLDVDPCPQELCCARQLAREVRLPLLDRPAGAHGRCHAALEKTLPALGPRCRNLSQRVQPFGDDLVIGPAGAEAVQAGSGLGFEFGGEFGEFGKQLAAVAPFRSAHLAGELRQTILHPPQLA
jgi:hypothetical protein